MPNPLPEPTEVEHTKEWSDDCAQLVPGDFIAWREKVWKKTAWEKGRPVNPEVLDEESLQGLLLTRGRQYWRIRRAASTKVIERTERTLRDDLIGRLVWKDEEARKKACEEFYRKTGKPSGVAQ